MAVLIEAVSVVIRRDAITKKYPGGWPAFVAETQVPSRCADNVLVALSFWEPTDADSCIESLVERGLVHLHHGAPADIEIVDQTQGRKHQAPWCAVFECYLDGDPTKTVTACSAHVIGEDRLFVPEGWVFEGSLSQRCRHFETAERERYISLLHQEDGRDIYHGPARGQDEILYVKRS